jgi:hypothetical protein
MYTIDDKDQVQELADFPQQDVGAPLPLIFATEQSFALAYYLNGRPERFAVVEFEGVLAHYFGGPNDEALSGHPLYARGLGRYAVYEVFESSWLRAMGRMNRVHPFHRPAMFEGYRHFIFTFHDTPLELLAKGVKNVTIFDATTHDRVAELARTADAGKRNWIE